MNELKPRPCPFCGCDPTLRRCDDNVFSVSCTHHYCWSEPDENGARTAADITIYADIEGKYNYETNDWEYTEEEINNCKKAAIKAWNTRAEDINELKPCPFCGSKASIIEVTERPDAFVEEAFIQCGECGFSFHHKWLSVETLIKYWNTRAKDIDTPTNECTCHMELRKHGATYDVFYFDCCDKEYAENRNDKYASGISGDVCPYCGARVVE